MSLKETDEEYVNCLVDYPAGAVYYFFREFRARKEYRWFFFFFGNLIHYNLSRANVEFFSEGKELSFEAWQLKMVRRGGDGAATAPPIDRPPCPPPPSSLSLSNPSRTCPRRWNVEIGKRFLHFLLGRERGDFATWGSEIELASSGLREKIRSVLKIHCPTNEAYYNRWMKSQSAN